MGPVWGASQVRIALGLALVPLTTVFLIFSGASQPIAWSTARISGDATLSPLLVNYGGTWFYVTTYFSYACLLIGSALLLQAVVRVGRTFTAQGLLIVVAIALPLLANMVRTLQGGFDLSPPVIGISAALLSITTMRMRSGRISRDGAHSAGLTFTHADRHPG